MFSSALKRALGEVKGGWKRSVHAASFSANSCTGLFIPSVLILLLLKFAAVNLIETRYTPRGFSLFFAVQLYRKKDYLPILFG